MTLAFGICLAVGAVMVLFSLFAGGDHAADAHDVDAGGGDADAHGGGDAHGDAHAGDHGHADVHGAGDFWLLFMSMRFWVFFLTFFGLTGLALELAGASELTAALLAAPMGVGLGVGAAWVFRRLREQTVSSGISPDELVGLEAKVMLPVSSSAPGKVRLQLAGRTVDRIAWTEAEGVIPRGERAMVIAVRGDKLIVTLPTTPELTDGKAKGEGG
ncbi:MAG: hypothetical protein HY905_08705 [Deltaproteobacteria bacterium]|nr:hypothetical protein [Deltaproteobacteria bacterium]